ncbi:MAG TPA: hypothetical protein VD791_01960 [Burkholderiales bacterium]|nr:hypothetical protein [Burkholderiales bacterium]
MRRQLPMTVTLATALAAAATCVLADVQSRSSEAIERAVGRASGDAYWTHRSDQGVPGPLRDAYGTTIEYLSQPATEPAPEPYGRAGGYLEFAPYDAQESMLGVEPMSIAFGYERRYGRVGGTIGLPGYQARLGTPDLRPVNTGALADGYWYGRAGGEIPPYSLE